MRAVSPKPREKFSAPKDTGARLLPVPTINLTQYYNLDTIITATLEMKRKKRIKIRKKWLINPKTRVKKSKKLYSRKKNRKRFKKEIEELK